MASVCFYFQVHQPYRVKKYRFFDIGNDHNYFNDDSETSLNNSRIMDRVSRKGYLPTNKLLLNLLRRHPEFKISFSFSGVYLDQLESEFPDVLESFQKLVATGRAEVLSETYYHSLSFLYSRDEFKEQVLSHGKKVKKLFGVIPKVFRNTELIYNNELARTIEQMGYVGILAEGVDRILDWRSPNFLYRPKGTKKIKLLLKNYRLSDDIAFRFSEKSWKDYPLTADKFANWVSSHNGNGEVVNLFMDYETFGEHQWEDTGIFNFLDALPGKILAHPDNDFVTPSESCARYDVKDELDYHDFVSWADVERDLSAWRSNPLQEDALGKIYAIQDEVLATQDKDLIEDWRRLQTSDHFYYMCTKWFADGDVHKYFNPYESPYDAFSHI
jgi:alpha-amylase